MNHPDTDYGKRQIDESRLEAIPFDHSDPKTLISFTCPEGTSLCPRSGFPDFWTAHIWYVPRSHIVELKSLKLYLNRYRDQACYHETLAHQILKDLSACLNPAYIKIVLDFTRRGNIQTDVQLEKSEPDYQGPKPPAWPIRMGFR